jgi:hypothetical protein
MSNFLTFDVAKREPAVPMRPVIDPAGWDPKSLPPLEAWSYRLTDGDRAEVIQATEDVLRNGIAPELVSEANFRLDHFGEVLRDVRRELKDGRGMVMLRGFPVEHMNRLGQAIAYMGIGGYLGKATSQNAEGHLIGHVKDTGADFADAKVRSYQTRAGLTLHSDSCTYVGLLCLHTAKSGGESLVASSVTVYNRLLERRPDLVEELTKDFYRSKIGEVNPGEDPFYKLPIFTFHEGYFSAVGAGSFIDKGQALPGVPKLTPIQKEAVQLYRDTARALSVQIPFEPGDIQFLNNCVALHSRNSYEDWPEAERKRHLFRLWLSDPQARPLPAEQFQGYAGSGVLLAGVTPNVSLDVAKYDE